MPTTCQHTTHSRVEVKVQGLHVLGFKDRKEVLKEVLK